MNILLIPIGSHGDVHPFVSLGLALQGRGHQVTVITNPHFAGLATSRGLSFIPLGTEQDYHETIENPDLWKPLEGFRLVMSATQRMARPLIELIRVHDVPGDTVLVAPRTATAARIAQEAWGVPLVTIDLQPAAIRGAVDPPVLHMHRILKFLPIGARRWLYKVGDLRMIDPLTLPPINELRAEFGLPPTARFLDWWASPQRILGLFPPWFAPPQVDWPPQVALSGFPLFDEADATTLDPNVEQFLSSGLPPIVFTAGSAMLHAADFFQAAVDACVRLGRRGLLLARFASQIPRDLPDGVRHFSYIPFSQVLPRSAAIVHHGGIGTTAQGLAAGIPHLVMPLAHDQPDNAHRLERLGVARTLLPAKFRGPAVARALSALLDSPTVLSRAREIAGRLDPSADMDRSCGIIEGIQDSRRMPSLAQRPTD
jgi:UDP:flavonoid glycosyltransferase YjiC (YdhE family)